MMLSFSQALAKTEELRFILDFSYCLVGMKCHLKFQDYL